MSKIVEISNGIAIREEEIELEFVLSGGPGGQKVNRTASAVVLRFDVSGSGSLPDAVKERVREIAGSSLTREGILVIHSRRYRSQSRNRDDAVSKLVKILRRASEEPAERKRTSPTRASEEKRLREKREHGQLKKSRNYVPSDDDMH